MPSCRTGSFENEDARKFLGRLNSLEYSSGLQPWWTGEGARLSTAQISTDLRQLFHSETLSRQPRKTTVRSAPAALLTTCLFFTYS
jgi:hypothetical protein